MKGELKQGRIEINKTADQNYTLKVNFSLQFRDGQPSIPPFLQDFQELLENLEDMLCCYSHKQETAVT